MLSLLPNNSINIWAYKRHSNSNHYGGSSFFSLQVFFLNSLVKKPSFLHCAFVACFQHWVDCDYMYLYLHSWFHSIDWCVCFCASGMLFFYYYGSGTVWLKSVMLLHNLNILYFFLKNVFIVLGFLVYKVCSLFLRHLLHTQPNSSRNEK